MLNTILYISIGAIFGATLRYYLSSYFMKFSTSFFYLGTMVCNILGSFLVGIFLALSIKYFNISSNIKYMVLTGFLGSFTTFSAFALETLQILENGNIIVAVLYVLLSVLLSILFLYIGSLLVR